MLLFFIIATAISVCAANVTTSTSPPIRCGEIPQTINACLGNLTIIQNASNTCSKGMTQCQRMTCIFRNSGWLKDGKVDKEKLSVYFDQYAKEHPAWSHAVQRVKETCLAHDLPAQGPLTNCPTFDVMFCSWTTMIKNALPSQWSTSAQCRYPQQFAASCPFCPEDCFAPLVPYGSCNACILLPRSP